MANHKVYENFVLENKIEDMLITGVDMNAYMTTDYSLTEEAGMKKVIHVYNATGNVQELGMGEGNDESITVSHDEVEYNVGVTQGWFSYYDEEAMKDPMVVDVGLRKASANMTNDLTEKVIAELGKTELEVPSFGWDFNGVVDAIALLNTEDEAGLFMLINPAEKAEFRKNLKDDLKYSEGFVRKGYIGTVAGVPVIVSKAVPEGEAYIATKEAVTCFVKKGVEVEQKREPNTRKNDVYIRKVMLIALTDGTKAVKLTAATGETEETGDVDVCNC